MKSHKNRQIKVSLYHKENLRKKKKIEDVEDEAKQILCAIS